jgi:hypothetical protein
MAIYPVSRPNKDISDRDYGTIRVNGRKYRVFRTSPLFGDMGYGAVKVDDKTYTVYRTKKEDGDIGYGVVDIQYESAKKQASDDVKGIPDDLAEINRAWPELPEHIKSKIEALVQTHRKEAI